MNQNLAKSETDASPIIGLPSQIQLRQKLKYDPDTGKLTWKRRSGSGLGVSTFNRRWAGTEAGSITGRGYRHVKINGVRVYCHRVIWKMMTGEEPTAQIDHINRDKLDNRWSNLRHVSQSANKANSKLYKNNRSGVSGVYLTKSGKWNAQVRRNRKLINLGTFVMKSDAVAARQAFSDREAAS